MKVNVIPSTGCPVEKAAYTYVRRDRTQLRLAAAAGSYETNYGTVLISSMFRVVDVKLPTSSTVCGALFMHTPRIRKRQGMALGVSNI